MALTPVSLGEPSAVRQRLAGWGGALDRAADAAISDFEPLLEPLLALVNGQGLLDIQCCFAVRNSAPPFLFRATYSRQTLMQGQPLLDFPDMQKAPKPFMMTAIFLPCWAVRM